MIVLLFATFLFASKPKMELLFSNLSPEDTGNVAMELDTLGIQNTFDATGNLFVPSEKRAQARASLAMKGKLPKNGNGTSTALKDINPFTGEAIQKEQLKSITEAELAQSIQFFDGVDSAAVQVSFAVDSPFEADKKQAQANVTISEKPGALVSDDQARAMASLVASAVPSLDKGKVTIFSRSGRRLWDGQDQENGSRPSDKLDLEKSEGRKRRDEIQSALNQLVGSGNAIAMVDVTLDTDESTEKSVTVTPTKPIGSTKMTETMNQAGGAVGSAAAGLDSNLIGGSNSGSSGTGGKTGYEVVKSQNDYGTDTKETVTKHSVGNLKSMAITILVNQKDALATPEGRAPIEELAKAALGAHASDTANFTSKVVAYPFDKKSETDAKIAEAAAANSGRMQQILSFLPIAALLIVAFMVVKSIGKLASRPMSPMMMTAGGPSLQMSPEMAALVQSPKALDNNSSNRYTLPEIVKQKALEAGISEEQLQAAIEEAGEAGISIEDIPSIKARVNVPLEQIKKMVQERPETVAMLIKSWLIEEGIRR